MALPRQRRVTGRGTIARVFKRTRPTIAGPYALRVMPARGEETRFAVIVPLAVHRRAVHRNALRRSTAEMLRRILQKHAVNAGTRVVITVRNVSRVTNADAEMQMMSLLKKSGILNG